MRGVLRGGTRMVQTVVFTTLQNGAVILESNGLILKMSNKSFLFALCLIDFAYAVCTWRGLAM